MHVRSKLGNKVIAQIDVQIRCCQDKLIATKCFWPVVTLQRESISGPHYTELLIRQRACVLVETLHSIGMTAVTNGAVVPL